MSTESESRSILTVPKWDVEVESCVIFLAQISALAEYHDCGDAMDGMMMVDFPTKSGFDVLQPTTTDPDEKQKRKLYLANKHPSYYDPGYDFKSWSCSDPKDCKC